MEKDFQPHRGFNHHRGQQIDQINQHVFGVSMFYKDSLLHTVLLIHNLGPCGLEQCLCLSWKTPNKIPNIFLQNICTLH